MSHPTQMEEKGIHGHSNSALTLHPLAVTDGFVIEGGRLEEAILTIADGTYMGATVTASASAKDLHHALVTFPAWQAL